MEKIKYILGSKDYEVIIRNYFDGRSAENALHYSYDLASIAYYINPDTGLVSCININNWMFKAFVEAGIFEELKYPYTESKLKFKPKLRVVRGEYDRGDDVIAILESLGGVNIHKYSGNVMDCYYFIDPRDPGKSIYRLECDKLFFDDYDLEIMTLPEKVESKPKLKVIQGVNHRGSEVIKLLKSLGGDNSGKEFSGSDQCSYYYLDPEKRISFKSIRSEFFNDFDLEILTLPDKPKLQVIQGVTCRGNEVIKLLEGLGGINLSQLWGDAPKTYYYIDEDKVIRWRYTDEDFFKDYELEILTLPEEHDISFKPFDKVLVRDNKTDEWICDFYSHYIDGENLHKCVGGLWCECIPYEGNEHLVFE